MVLGETGDLVHLPQLPQRGIDSDPLGLTAALLPGIPVDRGPRGWVLRPGNLRLRDRWLRDLDCCQETWTDSKGMIVPPQVKVQLVGPWSLAAGLETPRGHRALTDSGALRDLTEAFIEAATEQAAEIARRFEARVLVQVDEPLLAQIAAGGLRGSHDFEQIAPIAQEKLGARLHSVFDSIEAETLLGLRGQRPPWRAIRRSQVSTVLLSHGAIRGTAQIDALGELLDSGMRLGLGVGDREVRTLIHEVSPADDAVDLFPEIPAEASLVEAARAYTEVSRLAS